jgi:hypothetical protein
MSFGQTAFFGIGAYVYGAIGLNLIRTTHQTHAALVGGLVAASLLAAIVGYFMFFGRISDVYVSIITMALTLVLFAFAVSTGGDEWVIGVARFGGFNGMFGQGESSQNIANFQIPPVTLWLPVWQSRFEFKINRESAAGYYLVLGVCVGVYALAQWLLRTIGSGGGRIAAGRTRRVSRSLGYDHPSTSSRSRHRRRRSPARRHAVRRVGAVREPRPVWPRLAASTVVLRALGGRTQPCSRISWRRHHRLSGRATSRVAPFSATAADDRGPWGAFVAEATRRIVREAPLWCKALSSWGSCSCSRTA